MVNCEITSTLDYDSAIRESMDVYSRQIHSSGAENSQTVLGKRSKSVSITLVNQDADASIYSHYKNVTRPTEERNFSLRTLLRNGLAFEGNLPELADLNPEEFGVKFVRTRMGADYTVFTPLTAQASAQFPKA